KPGIFIFSAEEDAPSYLSAVQEAFDAAGLSITSSGRGYREYYKQKKAENPSWIGFEMTEDQTYVVVIGRKPEPTPEAAS
ncbi:MAG TPA: hypothetical protein VMT89_16840, partial [Candidatus Acidoferrales bacterium]|nr:hypothetical protein [Candidatus Acidoferrales bacterium]